MRFLSGLAYIVLSLVIGTLLVGLALNLVNIQAICGYLEGLSLSGYNFNSPRYLLGFIGAALLLLALRYFQMTFTSSRRNRAINFESPDGNVSITLFAIEDMLRRMLEERKEVAHIRPKVFLRRKQIEVVTRGVLAAEVNLIDFTKEIQDAVKKKLHILLGEEKEVRVNLEIRKVAIGKKAKLADSSEPEVPFRHYE